VASMRVIGVHPIAAREPVHLIELEVEPSQADVEWGAITQPLNGRDQSFWQVPYDERQVPNAKGHWCFFFHYLDGARPLSSALGDLPLPAETPVPDRLRFVQYEEP